MTAMIKIAPLQDHQITAAKTVIAEVAQRIFEPEMSSEQFYAMLAKDHELQDVEDYRQVYGGGRGLFLIALDGDRVIGTGAIRPLDGQTAELKRMWLLQEYHGQGIGYQLIMRLFEFARQAGYKRVVLQTGSESERAIRFYRRIGFVNIPSYYETPEEGELFMGIDLKE